MNLHVSDNGSYPASRGREPVPELESAQWATELWHVNFWFVQVNAETGVGNAPDKLYDRNHI